jgi:hypothetical protein
MTGQKPEDEAIVKPGADEDEATRDTEGHMFLRDTNAEREIARARDVEIERSLREKALRKEARPNRPGA